MPESCSLADPADQKPSDRNRVRAVSVLPLMALAVNEHQALDFPVLHEIGHVVQRHPGGSPGAPCAQARANEARADRFALDILRRAAPGSR